MIRITDAGKRHSTCISCFEPLNCKVKELQFSISDQNSATCIHLCEKCCVHLKWLIETKVVNSSTDSKELFCPSCNTGYGAQLCSGSICLKCETVLKSTDTNKG